MHENTEKSLTRDCPATRIPSGEAITLAVGARVFITQALGGSYTVATDLGLARIADQDADALGIEPTIPQPAPATSVTSGPVDRPMATASRRCFSSVPVAVQPRGPRWAHDQGKILWAAPPSHFSFWSAK